MELVGAINISQPNVVDVAAVGQRLRGRQCSMMPISYQTVSTSGTAEEIHAEARRYCEVRGAGGGYILRPALPFQPDAPPREHHCRLPRRKVERSP